MTLEWRTERRKLSALKDFEKNPRQISENDFERLKGSLKEFNLVELPAVDADNTILAGHMRIRALRKLNGNKGDIECRVPNRPLTEKERERYVLVSNRVTGEWDFDCLSSAWDIDLLLDVGFKPSELHIDLQENEVELKEDQEEKQKKKKECPECGHEF